MQQPRSHNFVVRHEEVHTAHCTVQFYVEDYLYLFLSHSIDVTQIDLLIVLV